MADEQQPSLSAVSDEVTGWVKAAEAVLADRARVATAADVAAEILRDGVVEVRRNGGVAWRVLPLQAGDLELLQRIARHSRQPALSKELEQQLVYLTTVVMSATQDVRAVTGLKRFISFGGSREAGRKAALFLVRCRRQFIRQGLAGELRRLAYDDDERVRTIGTADALAGWVGFAPRVADLGEPVLEPSATFAILPNAIKIIQRAVEDEAKLRSAAIEAGNQVRRRDAGLMLAEMPVARLKEATREQVRVGALTDAGLTTVLDVLVNEAKLEYLPGIGAMSAIRIRGAARALLQTAYDETPMRIDIKNRTSEHTELLRCLRAWDAVRNLTGQNSEASRMQELFP